MSDEPKVEVAADPVVAVAAEPAPPHPQAAVLGELDSLASRAKAAVRQMDLAGLSETVHDLVQLVRRQVNG